MVENKLKTKGTWGGARKGAGAKKGVHQTPRANAGRKRLYEGERATITFLTTSVYMNRISSEARRLGISRNQLFNRWAASLPPSVEEKTAAMTAAHETAKLTKKL